MKAHERSLTHTENWLSIIPKQEFISFSFFMTFEGTSIQLTQLPRPHPSQGIYKALTSSPDCPDPRLQTCVDHDFIYLYIYICVYIYIYTYIYIHIHTNTHIHTHMYGTMKKIYTYTHVWEPQFDFSTFNLCKNLETIFWIQRGTPGLPWWYSE